MPEKEPYKGIFSLSPALTQTVISQPMTYDLARQVERETNAYFNFDHETFGGVLYHPPGKGPENPYFQPKTDKDWLPEVQAISRIGVQNYYWDFLYKGLANGTCNPTKIYSLEIWPLYFNEDGSASVELWSNPNNLKDIAKYAGEASPRFPAYVPLVNCSNDADFYGFWENQIFPIDVKNKNGEIIYVEKTQLGLSDEIIEYSWKSWRGFLTLYGQLFHQGIIELCNKRLFPDFISRLLLSFAEKGNNFFSPSAVARDLIFEAKINSYEDLYTAENVVNTNSKIIFGKEGLQKLILAAQQHAVNLKRMYDMARSFRSDIYDYE